MSFLAATTYSPTTTRDPMYCLHPRVSLLVSHATPQLGHGYYLYFSLFQCTIVAGMRMFYHRLRDSDETKNAFEQKVPKRTIVLVPGQPNRGVRDWSFANGCLVLAIDPMMAKHNSKSDLEQAIQDELPHMVTLPDSVCAFRFMPLVCKNHSIDLCAGPLARAIHAKVPDIDEVQAILKAHPEQVNADINAFSNYTPLLELINSSFPGEEPKKRCDATRTFAPPSHAVSHR